MVVPEKPRPSAAPSDGSRPTEYRHTHVDHPGGSRNNLGGLALALGLLGVATCWIGIGGLAGIAAVVVGMFGRSRARRMGGAGGGVATAGLALGVLSTLIALLLVGGTWTFYERHGDDLRRYQDCRRDTSQDPAVCQQRFDEVIKNPHASSQ